LEQGYAETDEKTNTIGVSYKIKWLWWFLWVVGEIIRYIQLN